MIITGNYKGTRITVGNKQREYTNQMVSTLWQERFEEIVLPIIWPIETFEDRVGDNQRLLFEFSDRGGRHVCLAPEYTSVMADLAKDYFKYKNDVKLFYVSECFRGEQPQKGRFRQFTQLGVEILNPTKDHTQYLKDLVTRLVPLKMVGSTAERAMEFYTGPGFEFHYEEDGKQYQIVGGGPYEGGIGFAIGISRLMEFVGLLPEKVSE